MSLPAKREYTDKQVKFLNTLMDNGGQVLKAMDEAGYKQSSRGWLVNTLKDEIIDRTKSMLASSSVKAASRLVEGLDMDDNIRANHMEIRLKAANEILDRVGIGKKQDISIQAEVVHGVVMLPAKKQMKDITPDG
tara:strand:+ start:2268 stop:2672 length:405 start_codon:yes stop_codon:yes gene_type:complete